MHAGNHVIRKVRSNHDQYMEEWRRTGYLSPPRLRPPRKATTPTVLALGLSRPTPHPSAIRLVPGLQAPCTFEHVSSMLCMAKGQPHVVVAFVAPTVHGHPWSGEYRHEPPD
jgi:hypothetical protein